VLTIYSTIIGTTINPSKYLPLPYHCLIQGKRDMKEFEEYGEINMFHTD
jgi:hypothetical protein